MSVSTNIDETWDVRPLNGPWRGGDDGSTYRMQLPHELSNVPHAIMHRGSLFRGVQQVMVPFTHKGS